MLYFKTSYQNEIKRHNWGQKAYAKGSKYIGQIIIII